ncbi:MAG: hypothetical protein GWN14_02190, partial [candidate division Zixibacteria bacterium]|nr:hypothetical protein [Gammaproteobacteria bacterium]NIX54766.1 hypothetical protein [candidate division Zixibacteria bacterium]
KVNEPLCAEEDTKSEKVTSKTCVSDGKVEKIKEWDLGKNKDSNSELKASVGASWEGAGITMPILSDTSQVYGMLMGVDA